MKTLCRRVAFTFGEYHRRRCRCLVVSRHFVPGCIGQSVMFSRRELLQLAGSATLLPMACGRRPTPEGPHQDATFSPHFFMNDGEKLETNEFVIEGFHTPGHASNHVCYLHEESNWLFTGDHVIDGSTVVIDPPDGNMKQYIESLRRVRRLECNALAPGHGEIIRDPERVIDWIIDHRLEREAKVAEGLRENPGLTTRELVPHVYKDVDKKLYGWAERSLLAHLIKLEEDEAAACADERWFTR